ncbi:MAG: single-stranded-DNA-specific exonuclease RecJ [Parcubacteria group bacterium GW2011_GWA2_38_13b]|nr:MAG: single-stranded-DNA-specific exonuclease RecJ [Parcubacteria group bacterium GW2011_GWA2_38_13b]
MNNRWILKPKAPEAFFDKFPEINAVTLQLLFNRGIKTQKEIDEFLGPDYDEDLHNPKLLKDMGKAIKRVKMAISKKEKITVYGDYDADGICGATILMDALKAIGAEPGIYIPDRNKEGYGLNFESVRFLSKQKTDLIVTVDCGVSDYKEVELANSLGIDVVIIDHHTIPPKLPKAVAIINPRRKGDQYPFKELSATGVAFKFAKALFNASNINNEREKWLLDLVAISTITDRMVLLGENRTLVKYGLVVLTKTKRKGLKALLKLIGKDGAKVEKSERRKFNIFGLNARDLGFMIGPRLNAAGRIDHANTSFELLNSSDENEIGRILDKLDAINKDRQNLCDKIFKEVCAKMGDYPKDKIIIDGSSDWLVGIVGLIAGKLAEKYHRPALIYHKGETESDGSARTIKSFNIIKALRKAGDLLSECGGHAMAAGFHVKNENIAAFTKRMTEIANREIKNNDLIPETEIDMDITNFQFLISNFQINYESQSVSQRIKLDWRELYEVIEDFRPFGPGNEEPTFLLRGCVMKDLRVVGKNGAGHLKTRIDCGGKEFNCIGFGLGGWYDKIKAGDKIDIVFNLTLNEWNGSRNLEFKIVTLRQAGMDSEGAL